MIASAATASPSFLDLEEAVLSVSIDISGLVASLLAAVKSLFSCAAAAAWKAVLF